MNNVALNGGYLVVGDNNMLLENAPEEVLVSSGILNGQSMIIINRKGDSVGILCQGDAFQFVVDSAPAATSFLLPTGVTAYLCAAFDPVAQVMRLFVSTNYADLSNVQSMIISTVGSMRPVMNNVPLAAAEVASVQASLNALITSLISNGYMLSSEV